MPKSENTPNVRLAAKAAPLGAGAVTIGNDVVFEIPDESKQASGFYVPDPKTLIRLYPDKFKQIIDKEDL